MPGSEGIGALLGFMHANLFRHPLRTGLAFVSLVVAFLLLVLLWSIAAVFADAATTADTRLIVTAKYRSAYMLPFSQVEEIRGLDHVVAVSPMAELLAFYREPRNTFIQYGVFPEQYLRIASDFTVSPAALERMQEVRTGALVSEALAAEFGWDLGDAVVLESTVYPKRDGSRAWEFEIAGILAPVDQAAPSLMLFNYEYYQEATLYNRTVVGLIAAEVDHPGNVAATMKRLDSLFGNSPQPTRTYTFDYVERSFGRQVGDVGTVAIYIIGATFFTMLLVTGSVTAQSLRERRREFAILKALGFGSHVVSVLILTETSVLFLAAALAASALAIPLESLFNRSLIDYVGGFTIRGQSILLALVIALAGGLLIGAAPALAAARAQVCDGLRRG